MWVAKLSTFVVTITSRYKEGVYLSTDASAESPSLSNGSSLAM